MASEQKDQDPKKEIARGMDESAKQGAQPSGQPGKAQKGSDQISSGMADSGSKPGASDRAS